MIKPQTLVILTPGFPVNELDSTCLPPQQIFVRSLKQQYPNLDIVVLTFEYPLAKITYNWFGVKVIALGGKNKKRLYRALNWARAWRVLQQLNKQQNVVGLLSFWLDECALVGHYFAKKHNIQHFSWILGQDAKPGNRYFKMMKPTGDSLIALSDFIRKQVYTNYGIMAKHTIPPGVDVSGFEPGKPDKDIDILGVGSLIALKQYDVFIEVIKTISRYWPDIRAVLCGKGPEKENLQKLIHKYGLEKNILLCNELSHSEVLALMQRSRVFLHTSNYEGFGVVILEALYAGAQVVSFVKPMDEIAEHHSAVSNLEQIQQKVLELLLDEQTDHSSVLPYPIEQTAEKIMHLFIQSDDAICDILPAIAEKESSVL
ncbi:glycosyl transferase family 1 [Mucilaginibacter gracilis]|uniref:Glycosyl transferase family 1 n=1 Tax=Mucilaginibacter gracilis TaxID=423350 RepID=A0A495J3Z1_9SPHI|nr:glycosyltransferase family 4 protein [Mucilaginibacter gracilis]RKR83543.1 glycosyl transferase family 1 [Mucilaginibacter gracilis]